MNDRVFEAEKIFDYGCYKLRVAIEYHPDLDNTVGKALDKDPDSIGVFNTKIFRICNLIGGQVGKFFGWQSGGQTEQPSEKVYTAEELEEEAYREMLEEDGM